MMQQTASALSRGCGALLLLFALLPAAPRAANAQDAAAFVQNMAAQASQVLGPQVPETVRQARFRQLIDEDFDLSGAARFVLGPQVNAMSPQQQQEFMRLFRDNIAQSYSHKLAQFGGAPLRVTGSRPMGNETIVTSQITRTNGAPAELDWHVINRDGHFLITDVTVDGVSQKLAERGEFAGIIQRNGGRPESVIAALRQQLEPTPHVGYGSSSPPHQAAPGSGR